MSGHSRWSTIKRKKGAADAKKGQLFTRLGKEIIIAARMGGGDPDMNPRLRTAVQAARAQSMPKDNIERAIKKGTGELEGSAIEELIYEGFGPGGVAIIIEVATDNKNRTVAEIRNIFSNAGGNMGNAGSVSYLFKHRGQLVFDSTKYTEDQVMEGALEAGAQDVTQSDGSIEVLTDPGDIYKIKDAFEKMGMQATSVGMAYIPVTPLFVTGDAAEKILRLMERLEEHDDVQRVHANFDIDEQLMKTLEDRVST